MHTEQIVQIAGALLILAAFVMAQIGRMTPTHIPYQVLDLVGAATLAFLAYHERQWGFLLLEGTWAFVSLWALVGLMRGSPTASLTH
jgi:hypothetical protein